MWRLRRTPGGSDVPRHSRQSEGMTPLMWAAEGGHLEVVTYLVTHGSQLEATSRGKTPYDLVTIESYDSEEKKRKKKEVMDFLKTVMSQEPAAPVVEDPIGKGQQSAMLNRLLGKGSYESFDMRCMVTGQFSVGKSTLVKLLAGDIIPDGRHPTDGISLVEGRCGLDIETKEWILIDPDSYNALDVVYNKVLMTSLKEEESELTEKFIQASDTSPTGYAKATLSSLPSEQSAAAQSLPPKKSSNVPQRLSQTTILTSENVETRREELYSGIEELFKDHEGRHHLVLRPLIFVNAKDQGDPEIEVLKKTITELTFNHPCWGERMPNACVPLELEIAELVAEGKQIMSLVEVEELNAISEVSVLSPEQLTDFLHYQHSLGKIVYFDTPQLRDNVIISPLLMVEVMRSFITDVEFWPKEDKTRKTFKKMSKNGMIQKLDLYQIWEQEEFRQILPFKEYIFDMLIHLDIVSEQRRYDTKTGSRLPVEHFFVPCMLTQRNDTDFLLQECTPERTVSLAFVFNGTIIPPALPNRLICACLSMWTLKQYRGRKLMFSGFVGLSFDKEHDIVVCVEGNKILLHLVHKRSKGLIIPDIATSVRDCLFVTLERISEFYQSSIHCKASSKLPFHTEYSCSKLNCFTSENKLASETEECLCEHGENIKNNWSIWNKKREQKQCDANCPGLSEDALSQIPSDKELLRLSVNCETRMLHDLALHLGMEEMVWSDMEDNYPTNTQMVKFLTLMHLKENDEITFTDLDNGLREMEITPHKLCVAKGNRKRHSDISEEYMDLIPTDEILDELAAQVIGVVYFQLGIELGLPITSIDIIHYNNGRDLVAQCKDILFQWREDQRVKPTIGVLVQALENVGRGSECLERIIRNVGTESELLLLTLKKMEPNYFKTFIAHGDYESFENRVYLAGACNVGKSCLASILIGEKISKEWNSTNGLTIYFGRNGIHLEDRKNGYTWEMYVKIHKHQADTSIMKKLLLGKPNIALKKRGNVEKRRNFNKEATDHKDSALESSKLKTVDKEIGKKQENKSPSKTKDENPLFLQ
ncbi:unnamed protein product [Mytilus edulis]|uniref:Death domain-containing protein n=1 Tax=Mytilus edulis TaxID=6550 RepID=A0A8S3RD60_MYTED|nr:unnamed protein product [Mytilus edulis]